MADEVEAIWTGQGPGTLHTMRHILANISLCAKNPAFAEENEVRLVHVWSPQSSLRRQFRVAGERLTSYVECDFPRSAMAEVVMGPQCQIDHRELDALLSECGFDDVDIRESVATYRA